MLTGDLSLLIIESVILKYNYSGSMNWNRLENPRLYRYYGNYLNFRIAVLLVIIALIIGIIGFMSIEGYSLIDSIYMTLITISTVGYREIQPLSDLGKIFTAVLIIINIGVFAYGVSAFTSYVVNGEFFKNLHMKFINDRIAKIKDHIILCGFGRYGNEILEHFYQLKLPFVVIEFDPDKIKKLQQSERKILYVENDATHDDALIAAGIERASVVISALGHDQDNVFTVLSARQLNPSITIISRALDSRSEKKILLAGANHVIQPEQIGGFYMATLVTQPGAVNFFSFITNEYKSDISFEEVKFDEIRDDLKGKSIVEMNIRQKTGSNVIAFKNPVGDYAINPPPDTKLVPNSSFIILGDAHQLEALVKYLHKDSKASIR
jgi:voltage-gated potassium channel